jgi:ABC-type uncharacterized transport system substrate-binding protein
MRRREFIAGLWAAASPLGAQAQQGGLPMIALFVAGARSAGALPTFRAGLGEYGYVDGRNVAIEYLYLDGQYDRIPTLVGDLVRRRVAVIVAPGILAAALAAKAATPTIPIVFGIAEDPVRLGLVASLARPGGNATGMNFFQNEATSKRLGLLRELVPHASRVVVLINPGAGVGAETTLREVQEAARLLGWPIAVLRAGNSREIEDAFVALARESAKALFVAPDGFLISRRVQIATLAARNGIATSFSSRAPVEAGALMSYGTNFDDVARQLGAYVGQILKGTNPADLPVVQSTKFEFVINMQTAKALGIEVLPALLARADEVIE